MEHTYLTKLLMKTDDNADTERKHFLYVESKWMDNSLELHIYTSDTNKTFKGELSTEQLRGSATELDIPFDDFYAECREALTANVILPPFEYELIEDKLIFRLMKINAFAIEYLEVPLKVLSSNSSMLDTAIYLIKDLTKAKNVENEIALKKDNTSEELLSTLKTYVKEKENMEKKLLRKFLLLLNSKKDKINELKIQLKKYNTTTDNDKEQNDSGDEQNQDDRFEAQTQILSDDEIVMATSSSRKKRKIIENDD